MDFKVYRFMERKRIEYLDAVKGFAIFLMVMGHAIAWNYAQSDEICIYNFNQPIHIKMGGVIWQLIYSFHMPLFFMISGFLLYKTYSWKDFIPFLKKKVFRLLLPWICTFGIIYFVRGSMGYWFLLCLFQLSIIGFLMIIFMEKVNKNAYWIVDVFFMGIFYIILRYFHVQDWNISGIDIGQHFVNSLLPFVTGILLRKHKVLFSICIEKNWFYTCAFIVFFLVFISRYLLNECFMFEILFHYSPIILSIIGSFLVIHAFAQGIFKRFWSVLSYLGSKTLPVYILHILFVLQCHSVGNFILNQNCTTVIPIQILYVTFVSVIAIVFSIILYKIISISFILRRMFFGEW